MKLLENSRNPIPAKSRFDLGRLANATGVIACYVLRDGSILAPRPGQLHAEVLLRLAELADTPEVVALVGRLTITVRLGEGPGWREWAVAVLATGDHAAKSLQRIIRKCWGLRGDHTSAADRARYGRTRRAKAKREAELELEQLRARPSPPPKPDYAKIAAYLERVPVGECRPDADQ